MKRGLTPRAWQQISGGDINDRIINCMGMDRFRDGRADRWMDKNAEVCHVIMKLTINFISSED